MNQSMEAIENEKEAQEKNDEIDKDNEKDQETTTTTSITITTTKTITRTQTTKPSPIMKNTMTPDANDKNQQNLASNDAQAQNEQTKEETRVEKTSPTVVELSIKPSDTVITIEENGNEENTDKHHHQNIKINGVPLSEHQAIPSQEQFNPTKEHSDEIDEKIKSEGLKKMDKKDEANDQEEREMKNVNDINKHLREPRRRKMHRKTLEIKTDYDPNINSEEEMSMKKRSPPSTTSSMTFTPNLTGRYKDRMKFKKYEQKLKSMMVFRQQHFFHIHVILFSLLGLLGGLLIWAIESDKISAIDAIFTSYSALCITGLLTVDYSAFKISTQIIGLILITLGGLTLSTLPALIFKTGRAYQRMYLSRLWAKQKKIANQPLKNSVGLIARLKQFLGFQECPVTDLEFMSLVTLIILILATVGIITFIVYIILAIYLSVAYGFSSASLQNTNPWWSSLFLTISSFNNAGITPFQTNLEAFAGDWMVSLVVIFLILTGNTLFPALFRTLVTIMYLINKRRKNSQIFLYILDHHHNLSIHLFPLLETQIYVFVTVIVQSIGTLTTFIVEYNNSEASFTTYHWATRFLISLFHSVSTRTAGFNTVPISGFHVPTLCVYIVLMRIKPQMFCNLDDKAYSILTVMEEISKMEKDGDGKPKKFTESNNTSLNFNAHDSPPHRTEKDHLRELQLESIDVQMDDPSEHIAVDAAMNISPSTPGLVQQHVQFKSPTFSNERLIDGKSELTLNHDEHCALSRTSSFGSGLNKKGDVDELPSDMRHSVDVHLTPEGSYRVNESVLHRHNVTPNSPVVAPRDQTSNFLKRAWTRISTTKTPIYLYLNRHHREDKPFYVQIGFLIKQFFRRLSKHTNNLIIKNNTWLLLIIFLICSFDASSLENDPVNFTFLKVLFEVISAYGNVGLSMGYTGMATSFSAVLSTYSKILIIFTMILGRHRGLRGSFRDQNFRSPMSNLKRRFAKYYKKKKWWQFGSTPSEDHPDPENFLSGAYHPPRLTKTVASPIEIEISPDSNLASPNIRKRSSTICSA